MSRIRRFDAPTFLGEESISPEMLEIAFRQIQEMFNSILDGYRETLYAPPSNPENGMIVIADGTSWNPGSGAGAYERKGGVWVKL